MNMFIVNQNPESGYNDQEGLRYEYPTSIPNGKQIKFGDLLLFNYSKKQAIREGLKDKRIYGLSLIDDISKYNNNNQEYAIATYSWYKPLVNNLSFNDIGGDPRNNEYNSMNKVPDTQIKIILTRILGDL